MVTTLKTKRKKVLSLSYSIHQLLVKSEEKLVKILNSFAEDRKCLIYNNFVSEYAKAKNEPDYRCFLYAKFRFLKNNT